MKTFFGKKNITKILGAAGLSLALLSGIVLPTVYADTTAQSLPYSQDFEVFKTITVNSTWGNVPGIVGYSTIVGATTAEDQDPRTLLGNSSTVSIIPSASTSNTAGGVLEIDTASNTSANPLPPSFSPSIGLQGSSSAVAPNFVISLDTTSVPTRQVSIEYTARDLDTTADDAVEPIAVQFRVGRSGDYTNLPGCYIEDATARTRTTPSRDNGVLLTTRKCVLPLSASNQPLVEVRFVTTNRNGNDELVGIDEITIQDMGPIGPTAATAVIGGRVTNGIRSVARAEVVLTNLTTGEIRTTFTSGFGYYQFAELEVNNLYTVEVRAKKAGFAEPQTIQLNGDMNDVNISLNNN